MKQIRRIILLFLICASGNLSAQQVLSSKLSKDTILIGKQVEWKSKITVPREYSVDIDSIKNPITPGVEVIGEFMIDTVKLTKKFAEIETRAILTSFDSGTYFLPSQVINILKNGEVVDTLNIPSRFLEVTTVPIDTTTFVPYDIKPQFKYPVTFREIIPWGLGLLLLLVLAFLIYKMVKNHRENKTLLGRPKIIDPPHIVALRELEKIRGEKLWQNNKEKQYYTEISDTLRRYLEGRFSIQAMEKTSNEILEVLQKERVEKRDFEELKGLFSLSDLVKFAKYRPAQQENEEAILTAVRFVNSTFLQEMEEEKHG